MTAENSTPEYTEHNWEIPNDEKPGLYDTILECTECKKRVMYSVDNPDSLPRFGCTGKPSPLKTPPNDYDGIAIGLMLSMLADKRTDEEIMYMLQPEKIKKSLALIRQAKSNANGAVNAKTE